MNKTVRIMRTIMMAFILGLVSLACSLPGLGKNSTQPPTETITFPTGAATQAPGATQEAAVSATPAPGTIISFQGVSFTLPEPVAKDASGKIVPAEAGDPTATGWPGAMPEYYQFTFDSYVLGKPFPTVELDIFPIKTYAAVNAPADTIAAALRDRTAHPGVGVGDLPFLPMWNAGQVFAVRETPLDFKNGSGIRYLTYFSQGIMPITGKSIFYTYQGLTSDGNFYVSLIMPLSQPLLDSAENQKKVNDQNLGSIDAPAYEAYLSDIQDQLNGAAPESFTPNLETLDALVRSLQVNPTAQLKAPPTQTVICDGAMASRVKKGSDARVTFTDGTPLRVRQSAGKTGAILGLLPEGTSFAIIDGPTCLDKGIWWKVQGDKLTGWVLEGEGGNYFIELK